MSAHDVEYPVSDSDSKQEMQNKAAVDALYKALANGQTDAATGLLATDLEWWFHGPPHSQHMMRRLTGQSSRVEFQFEPRNITAIGDCVIAEGWEGAQAYWVHVWMLKDGMITQFREYFYTWLTVRDLKPPGWEISHKCLTLWQSQPRDLARRSLPGLLLAI